MFIHLTYIHPSHAVVTIRQTMSQGVTLLMRPAQPPARDPRATSPLYSSPTEDPSRGRAKGLDPVTVANSREPPKPESTVRVRSAYIPADTKQSLHANGIHSSASLRVDAPVFVPNFAMK